MIIKSSEDRLLFLRYALPCAGTLVKRGNVTKEYIDRLVEQVSQNMVPEGNPEAIFKVANAMCDSVAERMGKSSTDAEVIRRYFLFEHAKVVDDRFELMKDFNPVDCRTYPGRVVLVGDGSAVVETVLGRKEYRTVFAKDVKEGNAVVVHFDFVIEKITESTAEMMRKVSDEK
jgi:hydrogenase maturation factor